MQQQNLSKSKLRDCLQKAFGFYCLHCSGDNRRTGVTKAGVTHASRSSLPYVLTAFVETCSLQYEAQKMGHLHSRLSDVCQYYGMAMTVNSGSTSEPKEKKNIPPKEKKKEKEPSFVIVVKIDAQNYVRQFTIIRPVCHETTPSTGFSIK